MPVEAQAYKGMWWPQENEADAVSGDLFYSDDGLSLDLVGSFKKLEEYFGQADIAYPVVHGVTTDGRDVTLVDAQDVGGHVGAGVPTQRLIPSYAFVGAHIAEPQTATWSNVTVWFRHLLEWYAETGITENTTFDNDGHLLRFELAYEYPPGLTARLEDATVELVPGVKLKDSRFRARSVAPSASLRVTPDIPLPFGELWEKFAMPLQNLLTLATNAPCPVTSITLSSSDYEYERGLGLKPVTLLYASHRVGDEGEKVLLPPEMLFTAPRLDERFQELIRGWMAAAATFEVVCSLIFGPVYLSGGDLSNRVFNSCQAAEVFHRVKFPGTDTPEDDHAARKEAILAACPEEHRAWLADALEYSNEIRLRRRITELYDLVRPVVEPVGGPRREFVNAVVRARNDLAHRGRSDEEDLERLYRLNEAMQFMLRGCLLTELGYTADAVHELLTRNARYKFAVAWKAGH